MIKHKLAQTQMLELSRRNEEMKKSVMAAINAGAAPLLYQGAELDDTELSVLVTKYEQEAYAAYEEMLKMAHLIEATYSDSREAE